MSPLSASSSKRQRLADLIIRKPAEVEGYSRVTAISKRLWNPKKASAAPPTIRIGVAVFSTTPSTSFAPTSYIPLSDSHLSDTVSTSAVSPNLATRSPALPSPSTSSSTQSARVYTSEEAVPLLGGSLSTAASSDLFASTVRTSASHVAASRGATFPDAQQSLSRYESISVSAGRPSTSAPPASSSGVAGAVAQAFNTGHTTSSPMQDSAMARPSREAPSPTASSASSLASSPLPSPLSSHTLSSATTLSTLDAGASSAVTAAVPLLAQPAPSSNGASSETDFTTSYSQLAVLPAISTPTFTLPPFSLPSLPSAAALAPQPPSATALATTFSETALATTFSEPFSAETASPLHSSPHTPVATSPAFVALSASDRMFGTSDPLTAIVSTPALLHESLHPTSKPSIPSTPTSDVKSPSSATKTASISGVDVHGTSASALFGSIGRSPVTIGLTTIVSLALLAVLLGLLACLIRRRHHRRKGPSRDNSIHGRAPTPEWIFDGARSNRDSLGEDPDSETDHLPAGLWARRQSRRSIRRASAGVAPREMEESRDADLETPTMPWRARAASSDWTSIIGDAYWTDTDRDVERGAAESRQSHLSSIAEHPTPSVYSLYNDGPDNEEDVLKTPSSSHITASFASYQGMSDEERGLTPRPEESWRLSLDRVMVAATSYLSGKAATSGLDDSARLTSFSASAVGTRRAKPPPPIFISPPKLRAPPSTFPSSPHKKTPFNISAFSPASTLSRSRSVAPSDKDDSDPETAQSLHFGQLTFGQQHAGLQQALLSPTLFHYGAGRLQSPILPTLADAATAATEGTRRPSATSSSWGSTECSAEDNPIIPSRITTFRSHVRSTSDNSSAISTASMRVAPPTSLHPSANDLRIPSINSTSLLPTPSTFVSDIRTPYLGWASSSDEEVSPPNSILSPDEFQKPVRSESWRGDAGGRFVGNEERERRLRVLMSERRRRSEGELLARV